MRTVFAILLTLVMIVGCSAAESSPDALARRNVEWLFTGEAQAAFDACSPTLQMAVPVEQFLQIPAQLLAVAGDYEGILDVVLVDSVYQVTVSMKTQNLLLMVSIDKNDLMDGLYVTLVPKPVAISDRDEAVEVGTYRLPGTLVVPAGERVPAVVLVHGSGGQDRNESFGNTAIFKDLADGLLDAGIASLRYDKRTYLMNTGVIPVTPEEAAAITVAEETIEDAVAAAQLLRADPRIDPDRVFIVGHSLGAMLAPAIEVWGADAAGLVLMAGTLRHLDAILVDQVGEEVAQQFLSALPLYFTDEASYDYEALAIEANLPMLILQGADDVQVFADKDYPLWLTFAESHPSIPVQCVLYDGLGHFFVAGNTLDPRVLTDIIRFIQSN